jgi:hypothetical protein
LIAEHVAAPHQQPDFSASEFPPARKQLPRRPLLYFEEWDEPMISGIAWVSERIEAAGGTDVFADRAAGKLAKEPIVTAAEATASLNPIRFFDGRHWEDAQHRRIAEGGHVTPAGLNGAVTLQIILDSAPA